VNPSQRFGPVMNDSGTTAFAAALDTANESAVYVSANNTLVRIVGTGGIAPDGSTFVLVDSPSINASGDIAFWGITSSELGIFLSINGVITKVVASGDVIGHNMVGYIDYPLLSDTGHIAFFAMVNNGNSAIFLAQPRATNKNKAGLKKDELMVSSSTPLKADSELVMEVRDQYKRVIDAQRQRGREVLTPKAK